MPISIRVNWTAGALVAVCLFCAPVVARADLLMSGQVRHLGSDLEGVQITASWRGNLDYALPETTDSDGRFRGEIDSADLADSRTVTLSFRKPGYARAEHIVLVAVPNTARNITVEMSRSDLSGSDSEFESFASKRSQTGRTIFFIPYVLLTEPSNPAMDQLNLTMPYHIRYRILPTLNLVYDKTISVETIETDVSVTNTEKIRRLGAYLRSLAIVSGSGGLGQSASGEAVVDLLSEFVLPADASNWLPSHSYVPDTISRDELANPRLGVHLNELWVRRTLLALADKDFRELGVGEDPGRIVAFLDAAKIRFEDEAARAEFDTMIARIAEARP